MKNSDQTTGPIIPVRGTERRIRRPVYVSAPEEGVPIDIQSLEAEVLFDVATQTADVVARMKFRVAHNSGRPIFDLLQDVDSARLDGADVAVCDFRYDGISADRSQRPRAIDFSLPAASSHTLELRYGLSHDGVAGRRQPLTWLVSPRGLCWVCFTNLQNGGYLETWFPSNIVYDEFPFTLDIRLINAQMAHALVTNGVVTKLEAQHWRTEWPASDAIFSPVLVLSPSSSLESFTVSF
jgi:hypothetical protein